MKTLLSRMITLTILCLALTVCNGCGNDDSASGERGVSVDAFITGQRAVQSRIDKEKARNDDQDAQIAANAQEIADLEKEGKKYGGSGGMAYDPTTYFGFQQYSLDVHGKQNYMRLQQAILNGQTQSINDLERKMYNMWCTSHGGTTGGNLPGVNLNIGGSPSGSSTTFNQDQSMQQQGAAGGYRIDPGLLRMFNEARRMNQDLDQQQIDPNQNST